MKKELSLLILLVLSFSLIESCKKEDDRITDVDGNVYASVTIGTQEWMVENLKVTKYNDGSEIAYISDFATFSSNGGAYFWYDNNPSYKNIFGALYNPLAVLSGKLCPVGWHVPSSGEWNVLLSSVGTDGNKLKESGTLHWSAPNEIATNESGFTGLPGGTRSDGEFLFKGEGGYWWSSTIGQYESLLGYLLIVRESKLLNFSASTHFDMGASVRCLKN